MGLYSLARCFWMRLPGGFRRTVRGNGPLNAVKCGIERSLRFSMTHDDIYHAGWYNPDDPLLRRSAATIADHIVRDYAPSSVLDVGSGSGALLEALVQRGIKARGLEYSSAAIDKCRARGLDVQRFNLERDSLDPTTRVDLAISTEVAEHLPESCADRYVDLLCGAADLVVFTAATPGQGGDDHVNEQPHQYWIDKFARRGLVFDADRSMQWRESWKTAGMRPWYHQNLMIFIRPHSGKMEPAADQPA